MVRHPFEGYLVRICTRGSVIDVTPNHSLFKSPRGSSFGVTKAENLRQGDIVLTSPFKGNDWGSFFVGSRELAWLYGFFAAEGCAHYYPANGAYMAIFSNKDEELLRKCEWIINEQLHKSATIRRGDDCNEVVVYGKEVMKHFRHLFYTQSGQKKVPTEILNSPNPIREAFLEGYYSGDGFVQPTGQRAFSSKSWCLSQGILWLEAQRGLSWGVSIRSDKPEDVYVRFNTGSQDRWGNPLKDRGEIKKLTQLPYKGLVYDLVTSNHKFVAGVGNIVAHNTLLDLASAELQLREAIAARLVIITGDRSIYDREEMLQLFERFIADMRGDLRL